MKLEFTNQQMKLAHVNVRSELHGEEREAASDIKFEANLPNDILSELHPSLKSALYHYDTGRQDIADQGKKPEAGFLPHLKFDKLAGDLKWNDEMTGATIAILVPGSKKAIQIEDGKVNNVKLTPKEGGTVAFSFRFQCHPDEKIFGALATLVQSDVNVTLSGAE